MQSQGNSNSKIVQNLNRVYCMVPTLYEERKFHALRVILRTWGKRCDVIKFFVDPPEEGSDVKIPAVFQDRVSGESAEIVVVQMVRKNDKQDSNGRYISKSCWSGGGKNPDGSIKYVACRHIWEKVWRSWVYIAENDIDKAEWFFKVDDDTYLFPDFIRRYVTTRGWSYKDSYYFGHRIYQSRIKSGFIAGAMVGYSRRTLELAAPHYLKMPNEYGDRSQFKHGRCVDRDGATQELTEAICLSELGIKATPSHNVNGFEKSTLHSVARSLTIRKDPGTTYWFWHKRSETTACCSIEPLALHPMKNPDDILALDKLLFNESDTQLRDQLINYKFTSDFKRKPTEMARNIISKEIKTMGRNNRDLFLEIQWLLYVREGLYSNGFMDDYYTN